MFFTSLLYPQGRSGSETVYPYGLAMPIDTPKRTQGDGSVVRNTKRFYDCSNKCPASNIQLLTVANLNCVAFTANHVGSTHDSDAFRTSSLKDLFKSFPFPYHGVGDSAYSLCQVLMVPYAGINLHIVYAAKEWFNYWHSQMRITSGRINGVFIRRWGIFWVPLEYDLKYA